MKNPLPPETRSSGSSLVQLLVSLGCIAALAVLLLPVFETALENARLSRCVNQLRQLGVAYHAYAADHQGRFPVTTAPNKQVDDPTEVSTIGSYGLGYAPELLVKEGYLPNRAVFFCPRQKLYTYPDRTTPTGRLDWTAEGFFIGYTQFYLRSFDNAGNPAFRAYRNARVTDHPNLPLVMDLSGRGIHGDTLNVLYLDGRVGRISSSRLLVTPYWERRLDYIKKP